MMRLAYLLIIGAICIAGADQCAYGQMNRKSIKKNNKRISSYKGRKFHFGKEKIYNSIGISLNALNYYGDLSPTPKRVSTDLSLTRPAIGISFTHRFGPRYQIVGSFTYGGIRGSDASSADPNDERNGYYRYARNLSFRNRIKELSVVAQFDLFENQATYISRVKWTPYAYLGIAVFHHNPQAQVPKTDLLGNTFSNAGEWVNLQPLETEGESYKLIQPAIPFGLGARFRLNEVMDFAVEFGFRYTFTDYLDDVSGYYLSVDDPSFGSSELARAMSYRTNEIAGTGNVPAPSIAVGPYTVVAGFGHTNADPDNRLNPRGNPNDRDIYMVTTFRLTYIMGKTFHRAKFR
jgi:hypothetical protein